MADHSIGEDQVEIERIIIDLPDGEDPDLGEAVANQVVTRLHEILEDL